MTELFEKTKITVDITRIGSLTSVALWSDERDLPLFAKMWEKRMSDSEVMCYISGLIDMDWEYILEGGVVDKAEDLYGRIHEDCPNLTEELEKAVEKASND